MLSTPLTADFDGHQGIMETGSCVPLLVMHRDLCVYMKSLLGMHAACMWDKVLIRRYLFRLFQKFCFLIP